MTGPALPFVQSHAARIIRLVSLTCGLLIRARRTDQQGEDKEQEPRVFGHESPKDLVYDQYLRACALVVEDLALKKGTEGISVQHTPGTHHLALNATMVMSSRNIAVPRKSRN